MRLYSTLTTTVKELIKTHLDKRLDFGALVDFVFAHPLVNFAGIPVDAGDERVTVGLVRRSLVVVFDYDGLATRVPSAEDQHHLPRFHNLTHLGWI